LENSSDKINRELTNLQLRSDARRQRSSRKSSEKELKKSNSEYNLPMATLSTDDRQNPATMSFGINASPAMKNTETQTDKRERSRRPIAKFHSMADIRPNYQTYDEDTDTQSLTGMPLHENQPISFFNGNVIFEENGVFCRKLNKRLESKL